MPKTLPFARALVITWMGATVGASAGCAPRVSQWVQVTDCKQRHVVVPNARVYTFAAASEAGAPSASDSDARYAEGGATDANGNTWASFYADRRNAVKAAPTHAQRAGQPVQDVPANPLEPIHVCVNR